MLRERSDIVADAMAALLQCWQQMDTSDHRGLTAGGVIDTLYTRPQPCAPAWHADMRDALSGLLGKPDVRLLGNRLRLYRKRVFRGLFIDEVGRSHGAIRWSVFAEADFYKRGESGPDPPADSPQTPLVFSKHLPRKTSLGEPRESVSGSLGLDI
jgi:hypothetical protein